MTNQQRAHDLAIVQLQQLLRDNQLQNNEDSIFNTYTKLYDNFIDYLENGQ